MIPSTMKGAILPGNSTVELREYPVPEPGHGQVLIATKASTICGSDIRAIYREHLGKGAEGYNGVICGHEPAGQIVKAGPRCKEFKEGDRVVLYHISGCGICLDCREGYMISCRNNDHRAAYGWQRDGGMADYMVAEENTCVRLPDSLSYLDGACVACGFGTAYEPLRRMNISGNDRLLITGLGPVGLATAMMGRALGASEILAVDISDYRMELANKLGLIDHVFKSDDKALETIMDLTNGEGCEVSVDCSAAPAARKLALQGTRSFGRLAYIGEGNDVTFDVSPSLIHKQITLYGSWVTSTKHMMDLVERLDRWGIHPHDIVTDTFSLDRVTEAFELMDGGQCGKVAVVWDD